MKQKKIVLVFLLLVLVIPAIAQTEKEKLTPEDKQEMSHARAARINQKNDYALFRKQAVALKEYADEKKKAPKLQAENKLPVKVIITIDSLEDGDTTTKIMTGYIVQNIGDNATPMYDLSFDRVQKKIVSVKRTTEAMDADKEDSDDKATDVKQDSKSAVHKKNKDDDDDEPEEKPSPKEKNED